MSDPCYPRLCFKIYIHLRVAPLYHPRAAILHMESKRNIRKIAVHLKRHVIWIREAIVNGYLRTILPFSLSTLAFSVTTSSSTDYSKPSRPHHTSNPPYLKTTSSASPNPHPSSPSRSALKMDANVRAIIASNPRSKSANTTALSSS